MSFLKHIFHKELVSTVVATAINGAILHAVTDLNFWACVFGGYMVAEIISTSSKVDDLKAELAKVNASQAQAQQAIEYLAQQSWEVREKLDDIALAEHE